MSFVFFEDVLAELGHKLTYDAIVNYAGNSFCEKSWDMIMESNPLHIKTDEKGANASTLKTLADFFDSADVKIIKSKKDKGDI